MNIFTFTLLVLCALLTSIGVAEHIPILLALGMFAGFSAIVGHYS